MFDPSNIRFACGDRVSVGFAWRMGTTYTLPRQRTQRLDVWVVGFDPTTSPILRPSPIPNEECEAPSGHSYEADDKDDVAAMMDHPARRPSPPEIGENQVTRSTRRTGCRESSGVDGVDSPE